MATAVPPGQADAPAVPPAPAPLPVLADVGPLLAQAHLGLDRVKETIRAELTSKTILDDADMEGFAVSTSGAAQTLRAATNSAVTKAINQALSSAFGPGVSVATITAGILPGVTWSEATKGQWSFRIKRTAVALVRLAAQPVPPPQSLSSQSPASQSPALTSAVTAASLEAARSQLLAQLVDPSSAASKELAALRRAASTAGGEPPAKLPRLQGPDPAFDQDLPSAGELERSELELLSILQLQSRVKALPDELLIALVKRSCVPPLSVLAEAYGLFVQLNGMPPNDHDWKQASHRMLVDRSRAPGGGRLLPIHPEHADAVLTRLQLVMCAIPWMTAPEGPIGPAEFIRELQDCMRSVCHNPFAPRICLGFAADVLNAAAFASRSGQAWSWKTGSRDLGITELRQTMMINIASVATVQTHRDAQRPSRSERRPRPAGSKSTATPSPDPCMRFNQKKEHPTPCRYRHICSSCGAGHPAADCTQAKSA
jgi:hypothetical protein